MLQCVMDISDGRPRKARDEVELYQQHQQQQHSLTCEDRLIALPTVDHKSCKHCVAVHRPQAAEWTTVQAEHLPASTAYPGAHALQPWALHEAQFPPKRSAQGRHLPELTYIPAWHVRQRASRHVSQPANSEAQGTQPWPRAGATAPIWQPERHPVVVSGGRPFKHLLQPDGVHKRQPGPYMSLQLRHSLVAGSTARPGSARHCRLGTWARGSGEKVTLGRSMELRCGS